MIVASLVLFVGMLRLVLGPVQFPTALANGDDRRVRHPVWQVRRDRSWLAVVDLLSGAGAHHNRAAAARIPAQPEADARLRTVERALGPLIHVLFSFLVGWDEYMPFIPVPSLTSLIAG